MPLTLGSLFRLLVLAILAVHVFAMYCLARTWGGQFGFHPGQTILAAIFALIMLVPLLWAVTVPEWPEIYARHFRARRRWKRHRCPACSYDLRGRIDGLGDEHGQPCPECGAAFSEPEPYAFTPSIFRRFIVINALAWIIGCAAGEVWLGADERAFELEARQASGSGESSLIRNRRWPGVGELIWTQRDGISTSTEKLP